MPVGQLPDKYKQICFNCDWALPIPYNFNIDPNNGLPYLENQIYDFVFVVHERLMYVMVLPGFAAMCIGRNWGLDIKNI